MLHINELLELSIWRMGQAAAVGRAITRQVVDHLTIRACIWYIKVNSNTLFDTMSALQGELSANYEWDSFIRFGPVNPHELKLLS